MPSAHGRPVISKMSPLEHPSIYRFEILPTSQNSTPLFSHAHHPLQETWKQSEIDLGWKEWISYPFTVLNRREEFDEQIREKLVEEFMTTVCETWNDARLSTRIFVLQSLSGLGERKSALKNWLPRRRKVRQCRKKTE